MRTKRCWKADGARLTISRFSNSPLLPPVPALDNPNVLLFCVPMTYILHAGILESASIPPAVAINFEAQVVPISAERFGAINFILLSIYLRIFFW